MRIKVEIPDEIFSKLKSRARSEHRSINDLILKSIRSLVGKNPTKARRRIKLPVIDSDRPGTLHLDNAKIYELIDFP